MEISEAMVKLRHQSGYINVFNLASMFLKVLIIYKLYLNKTKYKYQKKKKQNQKQQLRTDLKKQICSLFPGATFLQFSRRVYLFIEQTCFFQEGLYVLRTDTNFPEEFTEQTCFFEKVLSVSNGPYYLINGYVTNFPRNPYLVLEHIRIFQEPLFYNRTDIHFSGSPI